MRLWHQYLIPFLDRQRLLGQHRECCALRGKGWGKKHSVVDYVFKHPYSWLFFYHKKVLNEMGYRGYKYNIAWTCENYRGKELQYIDPSDPFVAHDFFRMLKFEVEDTPQYIYTEHDDCYLKACLENLKLKNAVLNKTTVEEQLLNLALKGI